MSDYKLINGGYKGLTDDKSKGYGAGSCED
jgi:hypothetical protein